LKISTQLERDQILILLHINDIPVPINPFLLDGLNGDTIKQTTNGAVGPSGLDAFALRRLCSLFTSASHSLCSALVAVGRRIATSLVNPQGLEVLPLAV
jgi:hypothetical protein